MEKKLTFLIETDGSVTFPAYCLKTDSWDDYRAFMEDAEAATQNGNTRQANRFLRAALTCLFSHVEGVVNDIYSQRTIPEHYSGGRLCDRTRNIGREAGKYGRIPFINFRIEKHLRDLIAHPGISIAFSNRDAEPETLDQDAVFDKLSLDTLRKLESRIAPWLDAVCVALKVERLTDFEKRGEEAMQFLGEVVGRVEVKEV
jgi:hypothetical protein